MLDTDILSYLMKKNNPHHLNVMRRLLQETEGTVSVSTITISEISDGIERVQDESRKKNLLSAFEHVCASFIILEFNDEAAWHYGKIRSTLLKTGQDIGIMDTLIAAHASSQNLTLVTNNIKHFQRVQGLDITQWLG